MNIFARSAMVVALLSAGIPAANAQVVFAAKATLSTSTNGATYHATQPYGGTYYAQVTIQSSAHSVTITGEPASAKLNVQYDLYLTALQGNSPDDFLSGPIQCDLNGNFTHYPNSGAPGSMMVTYWDAVGPYTCSATADIFNAGNTSQKGHDSSSGSFTVVHP